MSDIMAISRHRMGTDGQGVTTLVGMHGCPLNCKYCINQGCHENQTARADYSPIELIDQLSIDAPYFLMSGGGITFGGGEPLLQAEFIRRVCKFAPPAWKISIETSLNYTWKSIQWLSEVIDYWIIDIKEVDSQVYKEYTGLDNHRVLENLKNLVALVGPEKVRIRYPLIPEFNNEEMREAGIATLRRTIHPVLTIEKFTYLKVANTSDDPDWMDDTLDD